MQLCQVENVVDDAQQRLAGIQDGFDIVRLGRRQGGFRQQLGHAEHPVHRRANLMAHVGQKARLGLTGLLGRDAGAGKFGLTLFGFGDVAFDGDPQLQVPPIVQDRNARDFNPQQPPGFRAVQNLGPDGGAGVVGMLQPGQRGDVGARRIQDVGGKLAHRLGKVIAGDPREGVVDPLDPAIGGADDDAVIGIFGHQGQPLAVPRTEGELASCKLLLLLVFQQGIFMAAALFTAFLHRPDEQERNVDQQAKGRGKEAVGIGCRQRDLLQINGHHAKTDGQKDQQTQIGSGLEMRAAKARVDGSTDQERRREKA